jgi:hypothetical protein
LNGVSIKQCSVRVKQTPPPAAVPDISRVPLNVPLDTASLSAEGTFHVNLMPGPGAPSVRPVAAAVTLNAIHFADAHPALKLNALYVYEKGGKFVEKVTTFDKIPGGPRRGGHHDYTFQLKKLGSSAVGKSVAVVADVRIEQNGVYKPFRVRTDWSTVTSAY